MASKPETTFYTSVHRHLPPPEQLHREKMANPYRGGTADHWYSGKHDLWIEWKFIVLPKRPSTVIDLCSGKKPALSALQQDWLRRRHAEGRNVWVVVGCKTGGRVYTDYDWEKPLSCEDFVSTMNTRAELAHRIQRFLAQGS